MEDEETIFTDAFYRRSLELSLIVLISTLGLVITALLAELGVIE